MQSLGFSDGTLRPHRDAVSIQLGDSKEVDVEVKDHHGREISFNDLNLQIALTPEQLLAAYAENQVVIDSSFFHKV